MTALAAVIALVALLVLGAAVGPRLLAQLAPTLSARPVRGMALWASAAALWVLGLISVGPLLAWTVTGPSLPGALGAVCQRCLAAANPFGSAPAWATEVPSFALLLPSAGLAVALLTSAVVRMVVSRRRVRHQLRALAVVAERRQVQGTTAWVLPSTERVAYALPRRHEGIVLSQGTLDGLGADEIAAVLAHERAHITGRHHRWIAALQTLAGAFSWVPLVAAAPAAVAGYAEMAADDAARQARGTRAVAGALLALHRSAAPGPSLAVALHAARHEPFSRAQRLVAPPPPPARAGLALVGAYVMAMMAAVVLVSAPYLALAVLGC